MYVYSMCAEEQQNDEFLHGSTTRRGRLFFTSGSTSVCVLGKFHLPPYLHKEHDKQICFSFSPASCSRSAVPVQLWRAPCHRVQRGWRHRRAEDTSVIQLQGSIIQASGHIKAARGCRGVEQVHCWTERRQESSCHRSAEQVAQAPAARIHQGRRYS